MNRNCVPIYHKEIFVTREFVKNLQDLNGVPLFILIVNLFYAYRFLFSNLRNIIYLYKEIIFVLPINVFVYIEGLKTNISHQLFDYKITFLNTQPKYTNSKGDFVLKNLF